MVGIFQARAGRRAGPALWLAAVLAIAIGLGSYRLLAPGHPFVSPDVWAKRFNRGGVALVFHGGLGATVLILGALQFFPRLRARWPAWHRRAGTIYVVLVMLAGLAGLILAFGTTYGPIASAGFALLALTWLATTANAWRMARRREYLRHERWMIRSYALTFAAVTLRLYLPIAGFAHLDFAASYRAISFLCWVPNLAFAELVLLRGARPLAARTAA